MPVSDSVSIRFDRSCIRLGVGVSALALAAVNYESNSSWLLACLVGSLGLVSLLHTRRNMSHIYASARTPTPVYAGEPIAIPIDVRCTNRAAQAVEVELDGGTTQIDFIDANHDTLVQVIHPPLPRGHHQLTRLTLRSRYPFGLCIGSRAQTCEVSVWVYPRPDGATTLPPIVLGGDGGNGSTGSDGDDFAGHRSWQPGDSPRRVDWRAVARGRPMLTKHFSGSGEARWLRFQDIPGDTETRLSQLTRWIISADQQGLTYGLTLPNCEIAPDHGGGHTLSCLQALATFGQDSV